MKNLLIILTFIVSFNIHAQENKQEQNNSAFGLKGGYNLTSVRNSEGNETDQRQGLHVGFFGESNITKFLALQIELTYSQQGYVVENSNFKLTQKIDYLNIPLMLKLYPTKTFYFEAGPQIGYVISHKENIETFIGDSNSNFDPHSLDWGANIGLGFKTETGLILGARYHYGLGKLYENTNEYNNVLQLSLGFIF